MSDLLLRVVDHVIDDLPLLQFVHVHQVLFRVVLTLLAVQVFSLLQLQGAILLDQSFDNESHVGLVDHDVRCDYFFVEFGVQDRARG